jgi:hypothetical protein
MSTYPPKGFEPAECSEDLLRHHPTFKPWTLKSTANAVEPYWVQCPDCGLRIPGSTMKTAAENWNRYVRTSNPHGAKV